MVVLCQQRKGINMYRAPDTLYVLFSFFLSFLIHRELVMIVEDRRNLVSI